MRRGKTGQAGIHSWINRFTQKGNLPVTAYSAAYFIEHYSYVVNTTDVCKNSRYTYLNQFATFDIETTLVRGEEPYSFMYIWQFCFDGIVVFGRYWEEFFNLISFFHYKLTESNKTLVIYVHNLSYEFQFIKSFFKGWKVFARGRHKVMKANVDAFEFRCSYFLSNESLDKFTEHQNAIFYKATSLPYDELELPEFKFDYSKFRSPSTELEEDELSYAYNDVRGLHESVSNLLKDDNLATIPLTNTGYVRRDYRTAMGKEGPRIAKKLKIDEELYFALRHAYRGGDSHASYNYIGQIIKRVRSFDYSSSYPYVMCMCKMPMSPFKRVSISLFNKYYGNENYSQLIELELYGVCIKNFYDMPYLAVSKCIKRSGLVIDNGRILSADYCKMWITELDYKIILDVYDVETINVTNMYVAKCDLLPKPIRLTTIEYFRRKTQFKDVDGKEQEYMKSKNRLNSGYGMMATDIVQDSYMFDGMNIVKEEVDVSEEITKHFSKYSTFLAYQWGVWITAHARYRLHLARRLVNYSTLYNDTDSVKFFDESCINEIDKFNESVIRDIMSMPEDERPLAHNKKKEIVYMGVLDDEGTYDRFVTWGCKKYAFEKNNELECTVAGLSKELGTARLREVGLENFKPGFKVEPSGNLTAYYNDVEPHYIEICGEKILTGSNLALLPTSYELNTELILVK